MQAFVFFKALSKFLSKSLRVFNTMRYLRSITLLKMTLTTAMIFVFDCYGFWGNWLKIS